MRLMDVIARLNGGAATPNSWSTDTPDEQSLSPNSCATFSDADADLSFTIGVTENTPYACHFCDKAFPRQSYLKRHEQVHSESLPYSCDYCNRHFKHKRSRDRHIKLHTGDKKYECPHCPTAFSRSDHLKIHMRTHDNGKPHQCKQCRRGYSSAAALTSHMQNHKKANGPNSPSSGPKAPYFRCLTCHQAFATPKELRDHMLTHEEAPSHVKGIKCHFCQETFPSHDTLSSHVSQNHSPETQGRCPVCKETFATLEDLLQHMKIHEGPQISCGLCRRNGFPNMDSLERHMQEAHPQTNNSTESSQAPSSSSPLSNPRTTPDTNGRKTSSPSMFLYACALCARTFNSYANLQKHTLTKHGCNNVPAPNATGHLCRYCNLRFATRAVRDSHEDSCTYRRDAPVSRNTQSRNRDSSSRSPLLHEGLAINGLNKKPFICSQCSISFPNFEIFREHQNAHLLSEGIKSPYPCNECDGQFPSEDQLNTHLATHFLMKEYGCPSCMKSFVDADLLQKHLLDVHMQPFFRCQLCKDVFETRVDMQLHFSMKHSSSCFLYKCNVCLTLFRSPREFDYHVQVEHLPSKSLQCNICGYRCISGYAFQMHMSQHQKVFVWPVQFQAPHLPDHHVQQKQAGTFNLPLPQPQSEADAVQNLSLKPEGGHFSSVAKKQLKCDMCDTSFSAESALNAHRRTIHNIRTSGSQKPAHLSLDCAYCPEICKSKTDLEHHIKTHGDRTSKHKCNICDELCPSATTLAEHKLSHSKISPDRRCVICHTPLKLEDHFHTHLHQHHPQGLPAPCVLCRQTLLTETDVQVHAKNHLKEAESLLSCCVCGRQNTMDKLIITGKQDSHSYMCKDCFHAKDIRCGHCGVKFESLSELEKHKPIHYVAQTNSRFWCLICQKMAEAETEIIAHVEEIHFREKGTNHFCHICKKVFDSPLKLQCHLIEHAFEGSSSYVCYLCNVDFASPNLIQQHMNEHGMDSKPFSCTLCHCKFFFTVELENHQKFYHTTESSTEHQNNNESGNSFHPFELSPAHSQTLNLRCSLCPEVFDSLLSMKQHHFKVHSNSELQDGKKTFPCTDCDQTFPCLSNLQGHMRMHRQGATFECLECGKAFAAAKNLTIHMRKHTGEKPYRCPVCSKTFARKENRRSHMKSHTGEKSFVCPHCEKCFSRKCHLKGHMMTHHITSTTHTCELCDKTFQAVAELKAHLAEAHDKSFEFPCSVCQEGFESPEARDHHLLKDHDEGTSPVEDDLSESSSLGQSSSSGDTKDLDSSDIDDMDLEDSDTRDSPLSIVEEAMETPASIPASAQQTAA